MFKVRSRSTSGSTQEEYSFFKPNHISFFSIDKNQQEDSNSFQNDTLSIRTYAIPREKHVLLHLLTNETFNTCLAGCVSEILCLLPFNQRGAKNLFDIIHFGNIKLIKRVVRITSNNNTSQQEFMGLLILAQVMVSFPVTKNPTKQQLKEVVNQLKEDSQVYTKVLKVNGCRVKRLTRKEQLHYLKDGEVRLKDVIFFQKEEDLISFLPKRIQLSNPSLVRSPTMIPVSKIPKVPTNIFHRFYQIPTKEVATHRR